jgi:hypothetical protein
VLRQLEANGLLLHEPVREHYLVGHRLKRLSLSALSASQRTGAAHQVLRKLVSQIDETCNVGILEDREVVYLDRVECDWPLRPQLQPGSRPAHCSAIGKLLLAYMTGFGSLARENTLGLEVALLAMAGIWGLPGQIALAELYAVGSEIVAVVMAVSLANARFLPTAVSFMPLVQPDLARRTWLYALVRFISVNTGRPASYQRSLSVTFGISATLLAGARARSPGSGRRGNRPYGPARRSRRRPGNRRGRSSPRAR